MLYHTLLDTQYKPSLMLELLSDRDPTHVLCPSRPRDVTTVMGTVLFVLCSTTASMKPRNRVSPIQVHASI